MDQERHLAEGIKMLIEDSKFEYGDKEKKQNWLNKYEEVFNPPKFGDTI